MTTNDRNMQDRNPHNHTQGNLIAFLGGELDDPSAAEVRTHLEGCTECRRELASLRNVWESLGQIPEEVPGTRMSERFQTALKAYEDSLRAGENYGGAIQGSQGQGSRGEGEASRIPGREAGQSMPGWIDRLGWLIPRNPAVQFALVVAILVVGGFIGYGIHGNDARNDEMVQLREEVRSVSRLLIVSLLQQQTASERLQGVSWSYRADPSDPEITAALLQALSQDPNVNVRLAALDALTRNLDQPAVRDELMKTLGSQSSPLLQLAIVDLVVESDMKESAGVLRDILKKPDVDDAVKKRIEEAINYLNI